MTSRHERAVDELFFARPTADVARDLIGATLITRFDGRQTGGIIVETEAYLDENDLASHAAFRPNARRTLGREPGTIYVYRAYGIHQMFNLVSRDPAVANHGAVLIRAIEPTVGIETMKHRRNQDVLGQLCSGPGKLCQALGIDASVNGQPITAIDSIQVRAGSQTNQVATGPRIGITRSAELMLRFFVGGNQFVSGSRRLNSQSRSDGANEALTEPGC